MSDLDLFVWSHQDDMAQIKIRTPNLAGNESLDELEYTDMQTTSVYPISIPAALAVSLQTRVSVLPYVHMSKIFYIVS